MKRELDPPKKSVSTSAIEPLTSADLVVHTSPSSSCANRGDQSSEAKILAPGVRYKPAFKTVNQADFELCNSRE